MLKVKHVVNSKRPSTEKSAQHLQKLHVLYMTSKSSVTASSCHGYCETCEDHVLTVVMIAFLSRSQRISYGGSNGGEG
jgi:hypothetical protein